MDWFQPPKYHRRITGDCNNGRLDTSAWCERQNESGKLQAILGAAWLNAIDRLLVLGFICPAPRDFMKCEIPQSSVIISNTSHNSDSLHVNNNVTVSLFRPEGNNASRIG